MDKTMTSVYKIELLIVNNDKLSEDELICVIENAHYPNRCIYPRVMKIEKREVEWSDDHPLNKRDQKRQAYEELFK